MARADVLSVLAAEDKSPLEFHFDSLWMPSMYNYLSVYDTDKLYNIATSISLASKTERKYKEIDAIMTSRGFTRFHAGTNRVVYRHLEDTSFVAKIAVSKVAIDDNPKEFQNQAFLKPFVCKIFEVSPGGAVGFAEKLDPITSIMEFSTIAGDVYDVINHCIIGRYVLEDIGTKAFMNWGIRKGFGVALLDYPFAFELDGAKLFCKAPIYPNSPFPVCDGEIDYDIGFNNLVCTKCGKAYRARDLANEIKQNLIIAKGAKSTMKVAVKLGDEVLFVKGSESETIDEVKKSTVYSAKATKPIEVKVVVKDRPSNRPNDRLKNAIRDQQNQVKQQKYSNQNQNVKPVYEKKEVPIEQQINTQYPSKKQEEKRTQKEENAEKTYEVDKTILSDY